MVLLVPTMRLELSIRGDPMNIRRLPVAFLLIGFVLKTLLVLLWRLWQPAVVLNLLIYYDPGGSYFAENMTSVFFDPRRLAPPPGEAVLFEVFLVIGFAIECLVVGFLFQWLLRRFQGWGAPPTTTTP